jgi:hypothetical protein
MAFGLGAAAIMLDGLLAPDHTLVPYQFAFLVLALLMLGALVDHWRLAHDAGSSVSESRRS